MSDSAEVSVVIPVYNGRAFVRNAVESALSQGPVVAEVLVCDDGSTDGTRELVESIDGRVTLVRLPHSGDPSLVRNAGVERASCELVAFLDADDVWLPGKIQAQAAELALRSGVGLVSTNALRQTAPGLVEGLEPLLPPDAGSSGWVLDSLVRDNFIVTSSVLALRRILLDAGLFSANERLPGVEDYDLWLRVACITQVAYLERPWLVYRDWGSSHRAEWSRIETEQGLLRALERVEERFPVASSAHRDAFKARRIAVNRDIAETALALGAYPIARAAARRVAVEQPLERENWRRLARAWLRDGGPAPD